METIDWDQLALSAAERDLAGIVREIAARYAQQCASTARAVPPHDVAVMQTHGGSNEANDPNHPNEAAPAPALDWRTLLAIADEAEADIGLHARHEPWALARLLRLPGDEVLRRDGALPPLDALVDLHWPDAAAPLVFRAIVAAFAGDDPRGGEAAPFTADQSVRALASHTAASYVHLPACPA
ncbi:hypothetical protein PEP31012_04002 [Pandoraea eparura]|jgi:hypothetical protein|uniref:Uncharacterized protein n=1 Tax=Pandoraea eparura TaxID=2508291 RepID=A0A5E4XMD8_9BURK|nr:DUF2471 family protein [Pandoraea eparura]VVE37443.1 hypothetical protein PEP31012_04002 [Pandoraea eparura]